MSGALFAFLLSWGNFPLSLFTTGADTTVPEYLYAKMVAGYTPGVPVLGHLRPCSARRPAARRPAPSAACGVTPADRGDKRSCSPPSPGSVVVTGASKGIGKGIARVFARPGCKVLVVARTGADAEAAAAELGKGASGFAADVTKLDDMEAMAEAAVDRHGGIDILCANAGIFPLAKLEDMTTETGTRSWAPTSRACSSP